MIDRIAFTIFGLSVYWYGIFYVLGFLFAYFFVLHYAKDFGFKDKEKIEDIFLYTMIFGVIGGRVFYILFYNLSYYLSSPIKVFAVWEGGMSAHGGILFVLGTLYYFARKYKYNFFSLTDLFAAPAALGFAFGRFGNFINQELVGKVTSSRFGIVFPDYDNMKRWPVVLFDGAKSLVLFVTIYTMSIFGKFKPGVLTALFIIGYSLPRFFIDFLREPDVLVFAWMSMGQLLSLVYAAVGFALLFRVLK